MVYGGSDGRYYSHNLPNDCFAQIQAFESAKHLVAHVAFTAGGGWSVVSNVNLP